MKRQFLFVILVIVASIAKAQSAYDSISISKIVADEEKSYEINWRGILEGGYFANYISNEKTIWVRPAATSKAVPPVIYLADRIKKNGTADVAKCFIPRHSINFYNGGKIVRYLLVCFECHGIRLSDEVNASFLKSEKQREKQMAQLKELFKELL